MGKCSSTVTEIRFVIEPELTHCYVYVTAEGDCPLGVQGVHHKAFPASMDCLAILKANFHDFLLWSLEAPR